MTQMMLIGSLPTSEGALVPLLVISSDTLCQGPDQLRHGIWF